jgi:hypothetical protein
MTAMVFQDLFSSPMYGIAFGTSPPLLQTASLLSLSFLDKEYTCALPDPIVSQSMDTISSPDTSLSLNQHLDILKSNPNCIYRQSGIYCINITREKDGGLINSVLTTTYR